jgi:hypothetical protein
VYFVVGGVASCRLPFDKESCRCLCAFRAPLQIVYLSRKTEEGGYAKVSSSFTG